MNNRKLKTEELDQIGRNLLESAKFKDEEIEKIIAAPQLFSLVKAGIEKQKLQQNAKSFLWFNWQKATLSFGMAAVVIIGIIGYSVFVNWNSLQTVETVELIPPEISIPETLAESLVVSLREAESAKPKQDLMRHPNFKKEPLKSPKSIVKAKKPEIIKEIEQEKEFYPITFVGDLDDLQADAQIVRVELSRSALLSLGVTPPRENVTEKIKTELLIGSDGVTRGIRFVE